MSIKSSINEVSNIRVLFYFPYNYKNRVLACFQTRPEAAMPPPSLSSLPLSVGSHYKITAKPASANVKAWLPLEITAKPSNANGKAWFEF